MYIHWKKYYKKCQKTNNNKSAKEKEQNEKRKKLFFFTILIRIKLQSLDINSKCLQVKRKINKLTINMKYVSTSHKTSTTVKRKKSVRIFTALLIGRLNVSQTYRNLFAKQKGVLLLTEGAVSSRDLLTWAYSAIHQPGQLAVPNHCSYKAIHQIPH